MLAGIVFLSIPAKRHRWPSRMGLVVCVLALGSLVGCGGGGTHSGGGGTTTTGTGTAGTSADTYTIKVRATDVATGTLTAESDIQFVVE